VGKEKGEGGERRVGETAEGGIYVGSVDSLINIWIDSSLAE
jgi:hypothetical protein